jgi:hypothetical protein
LRCVIVRACDGGAAGVIVRGCDGGAAGVIVRETGIVLGVAVRGVFGR